jgi:uncharacterized protein
VNALLKKAILILSLGILPACSATFPARPEGPVGDLASVLNASAVSAITQISQSLWEQAGFGLVVATLPSLGDETIETYASSLYEKWGIGAKGRDEGALILLSLDPRRARIEVGYGAEGYLNDAKAGRLLDTYGIPYFKTGDYSRGFVALAAEIARIVATEKGISLALPVRTPPRKANSPSPLSLLFFIVIAVMLMSTRFGRSILLGLILSGLFNDRRGGGFSSGGFGGGFGGGSFGGGFGGGSSGGGGASRSF